jgi:hypothetical protein
VRLALLLQATPIFLSGMSMTQNPRQHALTASGSDANIKNWVPTSRESPLKIYSTRRLLILLVSALGLSLLTEGAAGDVVVVKGADEWLFYANEFDNLCHSKMTMSEIVQRLQRFADIIQHSGRKIAIVVGPNKSVIYPEKLGPAQPQFACADQARQQLRALLAAQQSFPFLDVYSALLQAKSAGPLLWYPNDVHWQPRSAMIMTGMLINAIDPGLWNPADVHDLPPQSHIGDLGRRIGDTTPRYYPSVTLARPGIQVQRLNDPPAGIEALAWQHFETIRGSHAARVDGRLLDLHDSLTLPAIPWLSQFFQESRFARWADMTLFSPDILANYVASSDVVMLEVAEQALPLFAEHLSDSFLETMARTLERSSK